MIAHLTGRLLLKTPGYSIIDCQGVGYEIHHTPFTAERLQGDVVSLHIYTHVREDVLQLFGFSTVEEKTAFKELLKISGVGPRLALSILSGISVQELLSALASKDSSRLQKIPGIGRRTAERLVVELADRFKELAPTVQETQLIASSKEAELESVLQHLGYQKQEILRAVKNAKQRSGANEFEEFTLEIMVKTALRELSEGRSS